MVPPRRLFSLAAIRRAHANGLEDALGGLATSVSTNHRWVTRPFKCLRLCFAFKIRRRENTYFVISLEQILTYVIFSIFKLYG